MTLRCGGTPGVEVSHIRCSPSNIEQAQRISSTIEFAKLRTAAFLFLIVSIGTMMADSCGTRTQLRQAKYLSKMCADVRVGVVVLKVSSLLILFVVPAPSLGMFCTQYFINYFFSDLILLTLIKSSSCMHISLMNLQLRNCC